jgi:hypothetical protein
VLIPGATPSAVVTGRANRECRQPADAAASTAVPRIIGVLAGGLSERTGGEPGPGGISRLDVPTPRCLGRHNARATEAQHGLCLPPRSSIQPASQKRVLAWQALQESVGELVADRRHDGVAQEMAGVNPVLPIRWAANLVFAAYFRTRTLLIAKGCPISRASQSPTAPAAMPKA